MALPELTPEQREAALAKAQESRQARAAVAAKLRSREWTLADVFAAEAEHPVAKMRITQVLRALPGFGPVRVQKVLAEADVAETRRVRGLGTAQRRVLLEITSDPRQQ